MTEETRLVIASVLVFLAVAVASWRFYKPLSMLFGGWAALIASAAFGALRPEYACLFSGALFCLTVFLFSIQSGFGMPFAGKETRARYVLVYADWEHNKLYDSSHHEFTNGITHNGRQVVQDETLNGREIGRAFELVHPHVWKHREGADLEFYEAKVDFSRRVMTVTYFDNAEKRRQLDKHSSDNFNGAAFCTAFNHAPLVTKTFSLAEADLKV